MQLGFSTSHMYPISEEFLRWTAEQLEPFDYFRFEICHERTEQLATGGVDDFIQYKVLDKLNDHKQYRREVVEGMRRVLGLLKEQGKQNVIWSHELGAPKEILQLYPELATARGDLNLAHPLVGEWLNSNYDEFFAAVPEMDGIVLTMTEVNFAVAHRFDQQWSQAQCIKWLIETLHTACRRNGKVLIVRAFSAIVADYLATKQALEQLPDDIEIMLKTDPFDWDPFLPINPALETYQASRITAEFDLGGHVSILAQAYQPFPLYEHDLIYGPIVGLTIDFHASRI